MTVPGWPFGMQRELATRYADAAVELFQNSRFSRCETRYDKALLLAIELCEEARTHHWTDDEDLARVTMRGNGKGGRNTEFLLALAIELDGLAGSMRLPQIRTVLMARRITQARLPMARPSCACAVLISMLNPS
jgi:hypothetical protein